MKKVFFIAAVMTGIFCSGADAAVFASKTVLYSTTQALSGWYTGNEYSAVASFNGNVYFVMLDSSLRPFVGKISGGTTTLEALEKTYPGYRAFDDGHHEFSIGIDRDGYIHVTGDMHNFPDAEVSATLPASYKTGTMLYWKSKNPGDISEFVFCGLNAAERMPGKNWSYGRFVTDRNRKMYYISRTLARKYYYQMGGRGLGIYSYDETTKSWKAYGAKAPASEVSDASYPVVAWEYSGQAGGSYQQYKGDICFDKNNRMYLTTGMNTQNGQAQVNSVIFAYSDDGGETIKKAGGSAITLPMQVAAGSRQADVVDVDVPVTFEQPSVTYAFGNNPVIQYTAGGSHYFKYWTGSSWSGRISSPCNAVRGRVIFNDFDNRLYFINIASGTIYAKTSFTGAAESYNVAETFRYFDMKLFQEENILDGVNWKASLGKFEVIRLSGLNPVFTKTKTPVSVPTYTRTRTPTPASTKTYTRTATPVNTKTFTPTATRTRTATPANTKTRTPSPSLTITINSSCSFTPTLTPTSSYTSTRTVTPSMTPTMTITITSSCTFTHSPTMTISVSASVSPSNTHTKTPTITSSCTSTRTPTSTYTRTETRSVTPTLTPTASYTSTSSTTASPTMTITITSSCSSTPSATPTCTSTATSSKTSTPSCTFIVTATATNTGTPDISEAPEFDGPGAVFCYPNPAPKGSPLYINMDIKGYAESAEVKIYTVSGRLVRKIMANGPFYPGRNRIKLEARELSGLACGTYIYEAGIYSGTRGIKRKDILIILPR